MILTQYGAWKKYGISITSLQKKAKAIPRPSYFIDVKFSTAPRIDEDHPEWDTYMKLIKQKKMFEAKKDESIDAMKLIDIIGEVLTEEFGDKKALEIKSKIVEKL